MAINVKARVFSDFDCPNQKAKAPTDCECPPKVRHPMIVIHFDHQLRRELALTGPSQPRQVSDLGLLSSPRGRVLTL